MQILSCKKTSEEFCVCFFKIISLFLCSSYLSLILKYDSVNSLLIGIFSLPHQIIPSFSLEDLVDLCLLKVLIPMGIGEVLLSY